MSYKKIARSYAEALFSVAQKWGQEEDMGEKLASLQKRLEEDDELRQILHDRLVTPEEKEKALKALLPQLLARKSEDNIISIAREYQLLLDKARNMELMEVAVAAPLSPSMVSELENRLGSYIGKKIRLKIHVDPKILGGLVLRRGDQVVDASVKKKLEIIGAHLKSV
ncbi:MAG: ATP synthase F1 subunit delta [Firmicutes bacterium]|nr:ATP synthase F1 subunit delta [Bacillota bacterium]